MWPGPWKEPLGSSCQVCEARNLWSSAGRHVGLVPLGEPLGSSWRVCPGGSSGLQLAGMSVIGMCVICSFHLYQPFVSAVCICRLYLLFVSVFVCGVCIWLLHLSFVSVLSGMCISCLHMTFVFVACICELYLLFVTVACICRL